MDAMRGYDEDITEGETSTRPVVGIFASFTKNLVTRLADIEDEGSRCFHIVFVLHNK